MTGSTPVANAVCLKRFRFPPFINCGCNAHPSNKCSELLLERWIPAHLLIYGYRFSSFYGWLQHFTDNKETRETHFRIDNLCSCGCSVPSFCIFWELCVAGSIPAVTAIQVT